MTEELPFAPRRQRPLSLWNPLDYLVLLYWAFYFPQALRWYVERFGTAPAGAGIFEALRRDPIQRRLVFQALVLLGLVLWLVPPLFGIVLNPGAVPVGVALGVALGVAVGVALGVALGVASLRLDAWVLALVPAWLQPSKRLAILVQRASPLPIPRLAARLSERLQADWEGGLRQCEGLLRYSLQFIPVIAAIGQALAATEGLRLLPRVAAWCDLGPYDWQAVRYQSASLRSGLAAAFWGEFFIIILPRRWRPRVADALRYDTPARAARAGFWHLHAGEPDLAGQAFARVRHLACGEEVYANAAALASAARCASFEAIGDWYPPERPGPELLRPGVAAVLDRLGEIARDARLVRHSRSPRERNSALNRASGALKGLQGDLSACPEPERVVGDLSACPEPERVVVETIVSCWLELALGIAADVGSLVAREPVASPYIVGAPVPAERLVGREGVFDQIRSAWAKPGQRDSLVVYGHRRMGKTSVLRNLLDFCDFGADTGLAFLTLQTVDWSEPLADLCHAIAFALWQAAPPGRAEPDAASFARSPLAALRRYLAGLNGGGPERRYILVLDEYELLDEHLAADEASRFVSLLRGLTQQYPWLVVALVGLHSLRERSASFYEAIYAWRPVRVSFLDAGGVADVLQVEDDAFPLAYSPQALARIHRLTGGQPFLVQLVGDGLVQGFNRRLREEIRPPSPTLAEAEVEALVASGALYEQGTVYFRGIWAQAGTAPAGQHALLRALAPHPEGLDEAGLERAAGLFGPVLSAALDALREHDVLIPESGRYRYSVELMRLWVAGERMEPERRPAAPPD